MATGRHEKDNIFYTNKVWAKNILPEKVRKLQQNSIKGPKDPNSAKSAKKLHKVTKCAEKCHQKAQNCDITYFLDKTAFLPKIGIFYTYIVGTLVRFTSLVTG